MPTPLELANAIRRVAAISRGSRTSRADAQRFAIGRFARIAHATFNERASNAFAELRKALLVYDDHGAPPPLLQLAGRSTHERPYNAYLGWLLDPSREHRAGIPALKAIAASVGFDALAHELEVVASADIDVRCEAVWPEGAGSSKEPDLLVLVPRERPRAILLIENKVMSGESGSQYSDYCSALTSLAQHHGVPVDGWRAYLLAPELRETPKGWSGVITHEAFATSMRAAAMSSMPSWDRVLCYLIADTFLHESGAAEKLREGRELLRRFDAGKKSVADLRRIAHLLPLPEPFDWRFDR